MKEEWGVSGANMYQENHRYLSTELPRKKLEDRPTLVRFFDVGINLEGFRNYDQMALQVEDVFDVL